MQQYKRWQVLSLLCLFTLVLSACASRPRTDTALNNTGLPDYHGMAPFSNSYDESKYASLVPSKVDYGEKVIVVNPRNYTWGAYSSDGQLVRAGIANLGADFCRDEGHACRTTAGSFRIYRMGNSDCVSKTYPLPRGGSLMPYCMFFHNGQSLHGTPDGMLVAANTSHGCVHMRIPDAEWLRYNFAEDGTKVVILSY